VLHLRAMKNFLSFKPLSKPENYKGIGVMAVAGIHEALAQTLARAVPPGSRVADLGCGAGAFSQRLADMGFDVLSVDENNEGVFQAQTPFRQLDLENARQMAEFCEEFAGRFDAVICAEVIEHVENPWLLVRNIASLLAPGGVVIISTPNIGSWYSRLRFFLNGKFPFFYQADAEYGHIHALSETELELICARAGLEVQSITPAGHLPRLWLSGGLLTQLTNLLGFLGSFFMQGQWRGLCLIATARKEHTAKNE